VPFGRAGSTPVPGTFRLLTLFHSGLLDALW
jgi:hypothetical protein